jgi:hypothetical protein
MARRVSFCSGISAVMIGATEQEALLARHIRLEAALRA